jgi:predicted TIM-barrel fold metal-dependent hydrolase
MTQALDVHAHYYPPEYVEVVELVAEEDGAHGGVARAFLEHKIINSIPTFLGSLDERLTLMDQAGIEIQVLSFASLNIWHPAPEMRTKLVRAFNDGCADVVTSVPDRFRFLASLPLPHREEALVEAHRARTLDGFVGYSIPTHINTVAINDSAWDDVYQAMAEHPALVLTHPDGFCAPGALSDFGMEWAIGAPFEDTIAAVRLIASGLVDRHPNLTWVIPHLGGTLPFLLHRLLWRWKLEADLLGLENPQSTALESLLFETANCSAHTLALATEVLPADSIVFGTDFPFVDPTDLTRPATLVRETTHADAVLRSRLEPFLYPNTTTPDRSTPHS